MLLPALLSIVVGFAIATPLVAALVRVGSRVGALDSAGADGHAKALRPIPNIGGVGIAIATLGPMLIGLLVVRVADPAAIPVLGDAIAANAGRIESEWGTWVAIVLGGVALHVMGVVDDRRALGALPKLAVQLAVALVVTAVFDLRLLTALDGAMPGGRAVSVALTVVWIVAVSNAMNFLDNMDGLAGGVGMIAAAILFAAAIVSGQWFLAIALGLLVGALAGFLVFNFPPARIFMGDGGSLVVGWLLGVLTVKITFVDPGDPAYALGRAWYGVLMPVVVLAVPLYDLASVSLIRIAQGKSPLVGDQQHFSHRLVERGLTRRAAVLTIWGLALATGLGGIVLGSLAPWQAAIVGAQVLVLLAVLALLERSALRHASRSDDDARGAGS